MNAEKIQWLILMHWKHWVSSLSMKTEWRLQRLSESTSVSCLLRCTSSCSICLRKETISKTFQTLKHSFTGKHACMHFNFKYLTFLRSYLPSLTVLTAGFTIYISRWGAIYFSLFRNAPEELEKQALIQKLMN